MDAKYADADGLKIHYQTHGEGPPLVLLHGGLLTIEANWDDILPALAEHHRVIAIELQGHGRTADSDRPLSLGTMADDVVAVLDDAGIAADGSEPVDVVGFSLGGMVTIELARRHPDRVRRVVVGAAPIRPDGFHEEVSSPDAQPGVGRMPTEADFQAMADAYVAVAPDPDHFGAFAAKLSEFVGSHPGWTDDELQAVVAPTLVVIGDRDFVKIEHAALMQATLPDARVAVVPGATHMGLFHEADIVVPLLRRFLAP
jgi:pimeloyl-ACP methyl ester carboxylesterase